MNSQALAPTLPLPYVINTRPIERAPPLTALLHASGYEVSDMPMLTLQSRATDERDIALMRNWIAGDYQALVIVSPTAAASGLAVWQRLNATENSGIANRGNKGSAQPSSAAPSHLIAVGSATAQVFNEALLPVAEAQPIVLQPAVANNEGMLAMPEIEHLQAGDKLLVWRGLGGRRLLVDTLQARGVHIDSIAWYERTMPDTASTQYQQWLQRFSVNNNHVTQPKPIVIVSSGTAFEHWIQVVDSGQTATPRINNSELTINDASLSSIVSMTLADFRYVVLGARLASMVAERHLDYWCVEDLAPETILAAIQS